MTDETSERRPPEPDNAITLREAGQHFGFTVSTLRAEAGRGRLTIYKIGKRYYTTPADIREMVDLCRVERKAQDYTLIRRGANTSSETDRASSALAAASETAMRLKNSSRNTSVTSINRKRQVHR